jgi:hypothetical protein
MQLFFCGHSGTAKSNLIGNVAYVLNQKGYPVVPLYGNDDQRKENTDSRATNMIEKILDTNLFINRNNIVAKDYLVFDIFESVKKLVDYKKLRYAALSFYSLNWLLLLGQSYFASKVLCFSLIFACLGINYHIKPFLSFLARPKMVFIIVDDMTSYINRHEN